MTLERVVSGEGILAGERAVAKMWWPRLARERASAAPMLLAEQPVMRMVLGIVFWISCFRLE